MKLQLILAICTVYDHVFGKNIIIETSKNKYLAKVAKSNTEKKIQTTGEDEDGRDYNNEPSWHNQRSLQRNSKQKDVDGGKALSISCRGGRIKITKILYSCEARDQSEPTQMAIVKALCQDQEICLVPATREMFGNGECEGMDDDEMTLWAMYSCKGGDDITRIIEAENVGNDRCSLNVGKDVQKDVDGGDSLLISCPRGCIKIRKILYSCEARDNSELKQLKTVIDLCEDKDRCVIPATRDVLGIGECQNVPDDKMTLWTIYRCNGEVDSTRIIRTNTNPNHKTNPPPPQVERIQTTTPAIAARIPVQQPNPQPNLFQGLLGTLGKVVHGAAKLGTAAAAVAIPLGLTVGIPLAQAGIPFIADAIAGGIRGRGRGRRTPWAERRRGRRRWARGE